MAGDSKSVYTKYEKARIIGARALQISMGAPFLVKLSKEDLDKVRYNPIKIAKMEFEKGLIPMSVMRTGSPAVQAQDSPDSAAE